MHVRTAARRGVVVPRKRPKVEELKGNDEGQENLKRAKEKPK